VELWPRQRAHDSGATDSEEEKRAQQFPGEVKLQKQVGWMHKEQAEP